MGRIALLAFAAAIIAACAVDRPAPSANDQHRCVVIPTDMVECTPLQNAR